MLSTNDAFSILLSVVKDFYASRGICLGAALKMELRRRFYGFDERLLGFPRFGDFLRAAQVAGYVEIQPTPGGDLMVLPRNHQSAASATQPPPIQSFSFTPPAAVPRIRQDLWNAFNSFASDWVYDSSQDRAFRLRHGDGMAPPSGAVPIPCGRDRVLEWMRAFANTQDSVIKDTLTATLDSDPSGFRFRMRLRDDQRLGRAWHRFHIQQVLSVIEAWAATNGVSPKNVSGSGFVSAGGQWTRSVMAMPSVAVVETAPVPAVPSVSRELSPVLVGRLERQIDELIDGLVTLRGFLQLGRPK